MKTSNSTVGLFNRDDIVIETGNGTSQFFLVLSCGPRSYDLIEQSGGTTRFPHRAGRHIRIATDADFNGDEFYRRMVTETLRGEASRARDERKRGARIRRGHVTRY